MKLSHLWKAAVSTLIGLLIPIVTGIGTQLATGQVNWTAVKTSLIATGLLLFTDILKEIQKDITDDQTPPKP